MGHADTPFFHGLHAERPQQDMLALRVVARFGYAVAKPVSRNTTGNGYPFAVLNQAAA